MFTNVFDGDERAQVGIGTLIVFIAMVLVAAIAAGVLLNTAGLLQTQALSTGQESTRQVTNNLQVISEVGYNIAGDDDIGNDSAQIAPLEDGTYLENDSKRIYRIDMVVQKAAGASAIDVSKATIEYFGDSATTLTYYSDGGNITDEDTGEFQTGGLYNGSESNVFLTYDVRGGDEVLDADDDRVGISVLLGDYDSNSSFSGTGTLNQPDPLEVGEEIELVFTTPAGAQKFMTLQVPKIFGEDTAVEL
jgi:flagellin-like protein